MPIPELQIKLSFCFDHGHNGKEVKFFCYNTGTYEREGHTHDHEAFMLDCDKSLFLLLVALFYKDAKHLVERGSLPTTKARTAIELLANIQQALKKTGLTGEELAKMGNTVIVALGPLDPAYKQGADREVIKKYKQLLNLALQIVWRYEVVTYSDLQQ